MTVASGCLQILFLFRTASVSMLIDKLKLLLLILRRSKTLINELILGSILADRGRLRMSISYYFTGDCSDASVQEEIREKFITALSTSVYRDACLVYAEECKIDNVQVCLSIVFSNDYTGMFLRIYP